MNLVAVWFVIMLGTPLAMCIVMAFIVSKRTLAYLFAVSLSLASIGATVGLLGGLSRDGVVGDIMAAVLGLLGGVVVWLFAKNRAKGALVSVCVLVFSASLFLSYIEGAGRRSSPERYEFWRKACVDAYSDPQLTANADAFAVMDATYGRLCSLILNTELSQAGQSAIGSRPVANTP